MLIKSKKMNLKKNKSRRKTHKTQLNNRKSQNKTFHKRKNNIMKGGNDLKSYMKKQTVPIVPIVPTATKATKAPIVSIAPIAPIAPIVPPHHAKKAASKLLTKFKKFKH